MKNFIFLFFLLFSSIVFSQSTEEIANFESKSFRLQSHQMLERMDTPDLIDVISYDLSFTFNSGLIYFMGVSKVNFIILEETDQVTLDANFNLIINSVFQDESIESTYIRNQKSITVQLDETKAVGDTVEISVDYYSPIDLSVGLFKDYYNGVPVIATLSQPFSSSTWWVGIDNLKDKADVVDIRITHPDNFKVGSNGALISEENIGNNLKHTHWRTEYPIPAYLIGLAMSEYVEYNSTATVSGTTFPIINYVFAGDLTVPVKARLDIVPSYIEYLSDLIGDYPYKNEKYGHMQWMWDGGMEHATMSSQVNFDMPLTGHELAHQWFGNKVTCATWSDVWLNEGFATYFEGLLRRNFLPYGEGFFRAWKQTLVQSSTAFPYGSVYVPPHLANDPDRIFYSRWSYKKGAMVLHMLRFTLGDDDFFQAIKNYLNDHQLAYGFATTQDLQNHFEAQSGRDLEKFFADWVYGEGYPKIYPTIQFDPDNNAALIKLLQIPSDPSVSFFETEIEIALISNNDEIEYRRLNFIENDQEFYIENLPADFESFRLNPRYDIIAQINQSVLETQDIEVINKFEFQLYPNPASTTLHIISPEIIQQIKIYDSTGKIFLQKDIQDKEADVFIQFLDSGFYIIEATGMNGKHIRKFIKK